MGEGRHGVSALLALPRPMAAAVALLGVESLALIVVAVIEGINIASRPPSNLGIAVSFPVLLLIGGAVLVFIAWNLLRCRRAARGPGVAVNLCALVIAYYLLVAGVVLAGVVVGVVCLAVVGALLLPSTTTALGLD